MAPKNGNDQAQDITPDEWRVIEALRKGQLNVEDFAGVVEHATTSQAYAGCLLQMQNGQFYVPASATNSLSGETIGSTPR